MDSIIFGYFEKIRNFEKQIGGTLLSLAVAEARIRAPAYFPESHNYRMATYANTADVRRVFVKAIAPGTGCWPTRSI